MSGRAPETGRPHLLHGNDRRAMAEWLDDAAGKLGAERIGLAAEDSSPEEVCEAISAQSMFSPVRLILIKGAERLNKKDVEAIFDAHGRAGAADLLVFRIDDAEAKKTALKPFEGKVTPVACNVRAEAGLRQRLEATFREWGLEPEAGTLAVLMEVAASDPLRAADLAEQCAAAASDGSRTPADILTGLSEVNVFALGDAIFSGQRRAALRLMERLLHGGEEATRLLFLLVRHLRIIIAIKGKQGEAAARSAARYRVGGYFLKKYQQQARQFSGRSLVTALRLSQEADLALKGGSQASAGQVMTSFIIAVTDLAGKP